MNTVPKIDRVAKPNYIPSLDWANESDYEKAYLHIEEHNGDTTDVYYYRQLLEGVGKAVYQKSLREWINHLGKVYETKGFSL